uniref:Uncharacterized protein n=1 Tax=Pyxicephalus adspersus TaxID=30357 RepID=A0AAV3AJ46_PYXAD|nr:TPA: hypothetical protein GDO54_011683 [Pyxicephalus adspersus]
MPKCSRQAEEKHERKKSTVLPGSKKRHCYLVKKRPECKLVQTTSKMAWGKADTEAIFQHKTISNLALTTFVINTTKLVKI